VNGTGSSEVDGELPVLMDKGSIAILSSVVYHRSGANISDEPRRAYMPQFSWGPVRYPTDTAEQGGRSSKKNVAFAVPLAG
jgi:ectoine hydroxylase-related dioxygenase (phytanoyl-CoA dioxygenase family)